MLNHVALGLLIFVGIFLFYAVIVIHDIPYEIAKKRKHPHQDAIHVAGWVSLLTLHVIWPFLWIWATLYREDRGWGMGNVGVLEGGEEPPSQELSGEVERLARKIEELESQLRPGGQAAGVSVEGDTAPSS